MSFLSLSYINFRNLKDATLNLGYPEVFLIGKNGQGKTNFLEALYVSSYGNSFKSTQESQMMTKGTSAYSIRSLYKESEEVSYNIRVSYNRGKKEIEKDMKKIDRKELVSSVPCILFYISDIDFASGNAARKRFFFDQCLSMYDKSYLSLLHTYLKILMAKNAVIKSQMNLNLIDTYNVQFAILALSIVRRRISIINEFNKEFANIYRGISGLDGLEILYESTVSVHNENDFLKLLESKKKQEIKMGMSLIGPHRDKISFIKDGLPFDKHSSNGQKRIISLVLRILQAKFYTEKLNSKPIILMDDVMLELDNEKKQKFMSFLPDYKQLFCTFLQGEIIEDYKSANTKIFYVEDGKLSERN